VHWQPFADNIIPPFIANHNHGNPVAGMNKVLVYLPFESLDNIIDYLKAFPEKAFYCYLPPAQDKSLGPMHFRSPSRSGFLKHFAYP
ncbi:glycosyltransferase, partial [Pseudoalteromonas sp. S3785]